MNKIQFDTINGVYQVDEFDPDAEIVSGDIFSYLKEDFEGTRGAEVDGEIYAQIDEEYGIRQIL